MYTSDKDSETCGAELHDDVCVSDHLDIGGLAATYTVLYGYSVSNIINNLGIIFFYTVVEAHTEMLLKYSAD